ncbi:SdrD B-like domain-containing protein [Bacillus thuringiensis]|nr:SdrD B-like domain-containing protein [Bacillus thuringiensis]
MKKKNTQNVIYSGILSATLLGSSLSMFATQIHAEEKTATVSNSSGSIGDFIWEDINKNGKQDAEEPGISNVTLELYTIEGKKSQTVTTDKKGKYQFSNIPNGYYYVKLQVPEGYDFLGAPNFGTDQLSNYVLVDKNQNNEIDAGLVKKSTGKKVESIKLEQSKIDNATIGQTGTIKSSVQPEGAVNTGFTYKSKDPSVVTVDKNGNWKTVKAGTTTITVTSANGKTAEMIITVKSKEKEVESIKLEQSKIDNATIGQTGTIKSSVQPEGAVNTGFTYKSKDPNVVTVDKNGNWKAVKEGTTTITVTSANGKTAEMTIKVNKIDIETLKNGNFKNGLSQWTMNNQSDIHINGVNNCGQLTINIGSNAPIQSNTGSGFLYQKVTLKSGQKYKMSMTTGNFGYTQDFGTVYFIASTGNIHPKTSIAQVPISFSEAYAGYKKETTFTAPKSQSEYVDVNFGFHVYLYGKNIASNTSQRIDIQNVTLTAVN